MHITALRFNLQHTLESGQFFRFEKVNGWYYCYERDTVLKIKQEKDNLNFEGDKNHALNLLGLNTDYDKIIDFLSEDKKLLPAIQKYKGLRLMNRDPWETLVSFQCSILSNIPKIKKNTALLSAEFGRVVEK